MTNKTPDESQRDRPRTGRPIARWTSLVAAIVAFTVIALLSRSNDIAHAQSSAVEILNYSAVSKLPDGIEFTVGP
ncbi:MAG TPA: hypothetical protein EYQ82_01330 [Dehalococcoidia bacterium]|nr:hypothetical protein [Dehalococcoidia bacterium]